MDTPSVIDKNTKSLGKVDQITQMQALKGDIVDIKVAELEKALRSDMKIYSKKSEDAQERYNKEYSKLYDMGKKLAYNLFYQDVVEKFDALCDLFSLDDEIADLFNGFTHIVYNSSMDNFHAEAMFDIEVNSEPITLEYNEENIASSTGDTFEYFRQWHETQRYEDQVQQYRTLVKETKEKLDDFDYVARQVKSEISKVVMNKLGLTSILEALDVNSVFAIECKEDKEETE